MTKKVIVFIVEGITDQIALKGIFSKIIKKDEVRFMVMRGDITSDRNSNIKNIENRLLERINIELDKYKYESEDLMSIIHLSDTDGAFVTKSFMRELECENGFWYSEDYIGAKSIESIIERNDRKSEIMTFLYNKENLVFVGRSKKKIEVPYRLFYFSCNLEHVFHNKLSNYSNEEKQKLSEVFEDRYIDNLESFFRLLENVVPNIENPTYFNTWNFIKNSNNSLKRYSNLYLFFKKYQR